MLISGLSSVAAAEGAVSPMSRLGASRRGITGTSSFAFLYEIIILTTYILLYSYL